MRKVRSYVRVGKGKSFFMFYEFGELQFPLLEASCLMVNRTWPLSAMCYVGTHFCAKLGIDRLIIGGSVESFHEFANEEAKKKPQCFRAIGTFINPLIAIFRTAIDTH